MIYAMGIFTYFIASVALDAGQARKPEELGGSNETRAMLCAPS
jgi:hypothetical protein